MACYVSTETRDEPGKTLPILVIQMITDFTVGQMLHERMEYQDGIFQQVHHAIQPCSVCGKLVAVETEDDGEIISSGRLLHNIHIIL